MRSGKRRLTAAAVLVLSCLGFGISDGRASGASPYLPLNLSPEIERQIERVLVLGGRPAMTRPVPVATVLEALPLACRRDASLCRRVRHYLDRYFGEYGLSSASIEVAAASHSTTTEPNARGERLDSPVDGSASVFYRPYDHLLFTAAGLGYAGTDGRLVPDGTMASVGNEYLQVDAGWRSQWLSPLTDSSMLVSTEAPTIPSITFSNQEPIGSLGFQYQLFFGRMSRSHHILWHGAERSGYPKFTGLHLGLEPVKGWNIAGNAVWQYGGGGRPGSLRNFFGKLFQATNFGDSTSPNLDRRFSNRAVSITSTYVVPTRTPFEAYVEYAGRDTFHGETYRFRETDLSLGLHFPEVLDRFDVTLEVSEWQNAWYSDYVWLDGMTVDGYVTGNWGADWRAAGTDMGAQSAMISVGWPLRSGDEAYARLRTLQNQGYVSGGNPVYPFPGLQDYRRAVMLTLEYAQPREGYTRGLQLDSGRDEYGSGFVRLAGFLRLDGGHPAAAADDGDEAPLDDEEDLARADARYQRFVDLGVSGGRLGLDLGGFSAAQEKAPLTYRSVVSPHLGIGIRRAVTTHGDFGVRAEVDDFHGAMLALRVLDYRYRFDPRLAIGGFFGFARYAGPTPAQGYYAGAGLTWRDVMPRWDLTIETRYFDHIQRNKVLTSDPQNGDPVEWYTMQAASLYLTRRF